MIPSRRALLLTCVLLALAMASPAQEDAARRFYLKDGDHVVFYGDSITEQRLYTTFAETFAVTRFPNLNVRFVHSGWGGDRVSGGGGGSIDVRLTRDVIAYKPSVVTIMLGMNDAGYRAFDQTIFDTYATGYEHIIRKLRESLPGVRITAIQPSPYDDITRPATFNGGYNAVLLRYGRFVGDLVNEQKLTVADLNTELVQVLKRARETDPQVAGEIIPDRVHPSAGGHLIMAASLLKAWNAPSQVTLVEIDGLSKKTRIEDNTSVTNLQFGNTIAWQQDDRALPMPLDMSDPAVALAVNSSDFVRSLNQEILKVTGLESRRYSLRIDGETVGRFSSQELASGINLATLSTPMTRQAAAVHDLTIKHNDIHYARWREVQVPLENEKLSQVQPSIEALDRLEGEVVALHRTTALPKSHRYELSTETQPAQSTLKTGSSAAPGN